MKYIVLTEALGCSIKGSIHELIKWPFSVGFVAGGCTYISFHHEIYNTLEEAKEASKRILSTNDS